MVNERIVFGGRPVFGIDSDVSHSEGSFGNGPPTVFGMDLAPMVRLQENIFQINPVIPVRRLKRCVIDIPGVLDGEPDISSADLFQHEFKSHV
jgi:hypothetical protein